jgi:type IV pilus assembly protein PilC
MAIGTVTVLAVYVLPRFKTFFESFHATLPLPTRMLLALTSFIGNWWWGIVAVTFGIGALMLIVNRTIRGRRLRDRSVLKMPVVGALIRYGIIERFCRLLATMMKAGVPLPEAMAVLATGTKNAVFQEGLAVVREAMLRGDGLARPMAASRLFPSAVVQMIRVGENTGTLDTQLGVASDYYGEELEYKIEQFTSLFEPAVIVVMGLAVGFVAVAMISAMYGIYRQVQF